MSEELININAQNVILQELVEVQSNLYKLGDVVKGDVVAQNVISIHQIIPH